MEGKKLYISFILLGTLIILSVILTSGCTNPLETNYNNSLKVENLQVIPLSKLSESSNYQVSADITPNKDIPYMDMDIAWFDQKGTFIDHSISVWEFHNAKSGKTIHVTATVYVPISNFQMGSATVQIIGGSAKSSYSEKDVIYLQEIKNKNNN